MSKLVFSGDKKSVHIQFTNGSESIIYDTKEDILYAIDDCVEKEKITPAEADAMIKQVATSSMSMNSERRLPLPLMYLGAILAAALFGKSDTRKKNDERKEIKEPYVEMCTCDVKPNHAYIHNGDGSILIKAPFNTKNEGYGLVDLILEKGYIADGDASSLRTQIEMLPLLEDTHLN